MVTDEFLIKEGENDTEYFTRTAELIRTLRDTDSQDAIDGYKVVFKKLCSKIDNAIEYKRDTFHLDDATYYAYLNEAHEVIMKVFYKYNDPSLLGPNHPLYSITTFINIYTHCCLRNAIARTKGISQDRCRHMLKIKHAKNQISISKGIDHDNVSIDMIFDSLGGKISKTEIADLTILDKGYLYLDEDIYLYNRLKSSDDLPESIYIDHLPEPVKATLDRMTTKLSDLDFFILVKDYGLLGNHIRMMHIDAFVKTPTFLKLFESDDTVKSKTNPIKTVYNKKNKIKNLLRSLKDSMSMDDVDGFLVDYFNSRWIKIRSKYDL